MLDQKQDRLIQSAPRKPDWKFRLDTPGRLGCGIAHAFSSEYDVPQQS
jgi:hypothetical protein